MDKHIEQRTDELNDQELDQVAGGYYRYELKNVMVTSYSTSGAAQGAEFPSESLSLNFEEVKVTY